MVDRKATDIILELEDKLDQALSMLKNLEFKMSILLNQRQPSPPQPSPPQASAPQNIAHVDSKSSIGPKQEVALVASKPSVFQSAPDLKSKLQKALLEAKQDSKNPVSSSSDDEVFEFKNADQVSNSKENLSKKIPVQQRIVYPDGKNVYMANVEIYSVDGSLVKKTNTNQVGKWMMLLASGRYKIKVTKSGSGQKPKIDIEYDISVPVTETTFELEIKKIL